MEEYKWGLEEIDNIELNHLIDILDRRAQKIEEEKEAERQDGLERVLGAMGL